MAKPKKHKLPAQKLPQSRGEADGLLAEIGALERQIAMIDAELAATVEQLTESARTHADPLAAERDARVKALAAWAEANKSTLLEGDRRSHALAHGTVGWRRTPPAVKVADDALDAVIAELQRRRLSDLLRVTTSLDKAAILKAPARVEGIAGIAIEGGEFFFAQPRELGTELQLARGRVKRAAVPASTTEIQP